MSVLTLTRDNLELLSTGNVVVKISATWCGPCKSYAPIFDSVSDHPKFVDTVTFVAVDADTFSDVLSTYGVRSVPTTLFLQDGTLCDTRVGALTEKVLETCITGMGK